MISYEKNIIKALAESRTYTFVDNLRTAQITFKRKSGKLDWRFHTCRYEVNSRNNYTLQDWEFLMRVGDLIKTISGAINADEEPRRGTNES